MHDILVVYVSGVIASFIVFAIGILHDGDLTGEGLRIQLGVSFLSWIGVVMIIIASVKGYDEKVIWKRRNKEDEKDNDDIKKKIMKLREGSGSVREGILKDKYFVDKVGKKFVHNIDGYTGYIWDIFVSKLSNGECLYGFVAKKDGDTKSLWPINEKDIEYIHGE